MAKGPGRRRRPLEGPAGAPSRTAYTPTTTYSRQQARAAGTRPTPSRLSVAGTGLYGRGTADDGAGVITHVESLRALKALGELPVNVTVYIEGEEEVGSPSFVNFLNTYRERLEADVIVVADSSNWKVSNARADHLLRGGKATSPSFSPLDHGLHFGQFAGWFLTPPPP